MMALAAPAMAPASAFVPSSCALLFIELRDLEPELRLAPPRARAAVPRRPFVERDRERPVAEPPRFLARLPVDPLLLERLLLLERPRVEPVLLELDRLRPDLLPTDLLRLPDFLREEPELLPELELVRLRRDVDERAAMTTSCVASVPCRSLSL